MIGTIGMRALSALFAVLLVSVAMVPVMGAQGQVNGFASDSTVGQVVKEEPLKIEVFENTKTSAIVQVDDVLITLKSNPEHTDAVLGIEDLTTKEKETIHYKISEKAGLYTTEVYYKGELINTVVTDYDPLEPGVTSEVLSSSISKEIATPAEYYDWDGVRFAKGYGIKYPHPDYSSNSVQPWEDVTLTGNKLYHRHISKATSETIAALAPTVAGAVIGSRVGGGIGAVVGAVLGLCLTGASSGLLLDEEDCIWFWDAKDWQIILVPTIPPTLVSVPKYFRISSYTLWDALDVGTP